MQLRSFPFLVSFRCIFIRTVLFIIYKALAYREDKELVGI